MANRMSLDFRQITKVSEGTRYKHHTYSISRNIKNCHLRRFIESARKRFSLCYVSGHIIYTMYIIWPNKIFLSKDMHIQMRKRITKIWGNKMPTRCNRWIFIAERIACSTCLGHHYALHQELEIIIQVVAACRIWCLVFKLSVWCGAEGCLSGLRAVALQRIKYDRQQPLV